MKLGWQDSEAIRWGWSAPELLCEKLMTFLICIYLPTTFSALLWKHHHSSNPRVWFAFFAENRLTENDRITFLVLPLFWVTVLLPSYDCQATGTTTRMLHLTIFLSLSRNPWFLLLDLPPMIRHALCMPYHLTPGTWSSRHTGLPSWS